MIHITNLSKKFNEKVAVDNLSIDIGDGISGLVGENGAGKSTLFRLISGVYLPSEGQIEIDGFSAQSQQGKEKLFFLSDEPFFNLGDSPLSLYRTYQIFYDIDFDKFKSLLAKFHLPENGKLQSFSKGMKRQTFIALSLSTNVKYLLLDEAFDGLDPLVLENIKEEIVLKAQTGTAIVISTHNITLLEKLADRFIILYKGKHANSQEEIDKAKNLIKLQLFFNKEYQEEDFRHAGLDVVSYKRIGSIIHLVLKEDENNEKKIKSIDNPIIMEKIPIDKEESIKLLMLAAREEK